MTAIENLKFPILFYTQRAWNALHKREFKACCYFYHKHSNKETSHYTALIMVEYLRCFVLPFSAYPYRYRPPPRGTWGVPTSASVARDTSTRSMTSAGSSMVRWWRRNTTRCYAGNPTGARSAIIIFTVVIFSLVLRCFKNLFWRLLLFDGIQKVLLHHVYRQILFSVLQDLIWRHVFILLNITTVYFFFQIRHTEVQDSRSVVCHHQLAPSLTLFLSLSVESFLDNN